MEQNALYTIAYKGLKSGSYEYDFQVDDALFEAYDRVEIKSGRCNAHVVLKRSETMLELNVAIDGEVICECDRCLEDCPIAVDFEGDLVVKFSDEIDDYDGEVLWMSPAEDYLDLTQYIYESIVLSLPYRRVHEEGGCNPAMLASFSEATEEDMERMEAAVEESDVQGLDDYNKGVLAALKRKLEGNE